MFCSKCGYKNPDEFAFCQQCGNKLIAKTAPVEGAAPVAPAPVESAPVIPEPAPVAPAPAPVEPFAEQADFPVAPVIPQEPQTYAAPFAAQETQQTAYAPVQNFGAPAESSSASVTEILRRIIVSPMFIVGSICLTLSVIIGAIKNLKFFDDYMKPSIYTSALRNVLTGTFKQDGDTYATVLKIVFILLAIIGVVTVAGLFMTLFSGVTSGGNRIGTYGFTTLKISSAVNIFMLSAALITFEGFLIYRILYKSKNEDSLLALNDYTKAQYIAMAIVAFVVFAIAIALFVCIISSLSAAGSAAAGYPNHRASVFAAAIMSIYAGLKTYYLVIYFIEILDILIYKRIATNARIESDALTYGYLVTFERLFSAIALICFAVLLIRYKYSMKTAREVAENN